MKPALHVLALIAVVTLFAPQARAQEFHRNAYGMYAAPVFYGFAKGTEYENATSGAWLDFGLYYMRAFTPGFSARLEVRYGTRSIDDVNWNDFFQAYDVYRLSETILEVPVILEGDRRIDVDNHELRISAGGGASYKYVLDQKLLEPFEIDAGYHFPPTGSYQKLGLVLDGGATFGIDRKSAVSLRFRLDYDVSTFGAAEDDSLVRRFWATGFYAGFEYGL